MKPLSVGCQSSWKIDCVVASCSLDLQKKNPETYERYCKAGDTCKNRYANLLEFINHRERRQAAADAGISESHVETSMVHPCYWVNHHSPHYCIDDSGTIFNKSLLLFQ